MSELWYKDGLSFACTQCGNCCTGAPGYVWFTPEEGTQMAKHLDIEESVFYRRHAHRVNGHWTLNERKTHKGFDCVFLVRDDSDRAGCALYGARPMQCRTWPFWSENLQRAESWERAGKHCPGINQGKLYPVEEIRIIKDSNPV